MLSLLIFFAAASLIFGLLTIGKTQKNWNSERNATQTLEPAEKRFRHSRYRIRMNLGISFLLMAFALGGLGVFQSQMLMKEAVYCVLAVLFLTVWMGFWALAEGVLSYVHLSRKDACEVIDEERQFLHRELKRQKKTK